jgi:hypothetical protein
MNPSASTVWIQPAEPGCGACGHEDVLPACAGAASATCEAPALQGDPVLLDRVLQVLRAVADGEGNLVDSRRFSALRLAAGEAELTLCFPRGCGAARLLAEDAFQALRNELPDTDIYVLHASPSAPPDITHGPS